MSKKNPFALLINDIHVSKDNIPEFVENWNEALDVCDKRNIHKIIIGGDLWLSRSAQTLSTMLAIRSAIMKATHQGLTVIIAEGNHDKVDQESLDGYSLVFSEYPGVEIIDDYAIYEMGNTDLFVMSYFPENGSFTERYKEMTKEIMPKPYCKSTRAYAVALLQPATMNSQPICLRSLPPSWLDIIITVNL